MPYVDEAFYQQEFLGAPVADGEFTKLENRAGLLIEALSGYRIDQVRLADMEENMKKQVKLAVCAQLEFLNANGGEEIFWGNRVKSEVLGAYQVEMQECEAEPSLFAPLARIYLMSAGIPCRGRCL